MKPCFWLLCLGLVMACGCKNYDVKILQPSHHARIITSTPESVSYEPLQYTFFIRRDRLVMRITNPGTNVVNLMPEDSYVIDPWNQTDPIRGESISPGGSVVMTLPPRVETGVWTPYAPYWQARASSDIRIFGTDPDYSSYDWPYNAKPASQDVVVSPYAWRWPSGQVRLHLGYKADDETFRHDFVFERPGKK